MAGGNACYTTALSGCTFVGQAFSPAKVFRSLHAGTPIPLPIVIYNLTMRVGVWILVFWLACSPALEAASVGSGAPTTSIQLAFVYAWGRGGFDKLVGDPTADVAKFGAAGLIQRFPSISNSNVTLALVKPDSTDASNVIQVLAAMYAYY